MVKIKQKKTMNLPQLIEHIWANNLRHKWKDSDNTSAYVQVYDDGQLVVDKCTKDSVFTVEVEEEITEDTKLEKVVEVYIDDDFGSRATAWKEKSIKDILATNQDDTRTKTIHLINDDSTLPLIWTHDKGLVE